MISPDRSASLNDLAYPSSPHKIGGISIKLFIATKEEPITKSAPLHPTPNKIVSPPSSDDTSDDSSTTDTSDEEVESDSSSKSQSTTSDSSTTTTDSDSDDSVDKPILVKQTINNKQVITSIPNKTLKVSSESDTTEDDSDDTSDTTEDDSDTSDKDIETENKVNQQFNKPNAQDSSDSSDTSDDEQPCKKAKAVPIPQNKDKNPSFQPKHNQQSTPFRRVDPSKVQPNGIKSNRFTDKPGAFGSYGQKAYEDFSNTRGKGFRQEKNKKKRGSYHGGAIDTGVHSTKFNDSD